MKQQNVQGTKRLLRPAGIGIAFGAGACCVLLLFMSVLVGLRDVPQQMLSLFVMLAFTAGGFVSGYVGAKLARERGLYLGALCGLGQFFLLALANLAFDGSGFGVQGWSKLAAVVLAGALGGVTGVNARQSVKGVKR